MNQDFDGRVWADNHHKLSEGIGRLADGVGHAFARLNAHQFDAPWRTSGRGAHASSAR